MNSSNLTSQLISFLLAIAVGYLFFLAYSEPTKNTITRLINRYAEATTFRPLMTPRMTLFTVSIICAVVALMSLGFAVSEMLKLTHRG